MWFQTQPRCFFLKGQASYRLWLHLCDLTVIKDISKHVFHLPLERLSTTLPLLCYISVKPGGIYSIFTIAYMTFQCNFWILTPCCKFIIRGGTYKSDNLSLHIAFCNILKNQFLLLAGHRFPVNGWWVQAGTADDAGCYRRRRTHTHTPQNWLISVCEPYGPCPLQHH